MTWFLWKENYNFMYSSIIVYTPNRVLNCVTQYIATTYTWVLNTWIVSSHIERYYKYKLYTKFQRLGMKKKM